MEKFGFDNFKKGIITSVLGIICIISGLVLLFLPQATVLEATTVIILGLSLCGINDPRISGTKTAKAILAIIGLSLLFIWMSGCTTYKKCADKYGTGEIHTVMVKDTVEREIMVPVPAETIKVNNIDSLLRLKAKMDSLTITQGRVQVKFWKDKYNNLNSSFECLPDTITITEQVPVEVEAECPDTVILDPEQGRTWYEKLWFAFQGFSAWAVLVLIAWLFFWKVIRSIAS